MTKEEMISRIDNVNTSYLLGWNATERKDLCSKLLEDIKEFKDLKAPECWEHCLNNPGVYNELASKRDNND